MKESIKTIFENEEQNLEVLYYDREIIFIHGDLINHFSGHNLFETLLFVKLMKNSGITELQRAQIMAKVMNCVDEEIEKDKIDKTHGR